MLDGDTISTQGKTVRLVALNHADIRVARWPFKYLMTWPDYHRVHHSRAPEHHNKNFTIIFPVWDILFGTAHFVRNGENIKTGLTDKREPQTLRQYLFALADRSSQLHDLPGDSPIPA